MSRSISSTSPFTAVASSARRAAKSAADAIGVSAAAVAPGAAGSAPASWATRSDGAPATDGASAGAAVGAAAPASAGTVLSVLRHLDPALAHRVHDGLGPVIDCQLAQDRAHVVLDGLLADRQGVGDLLVGHALGDVVEDLDLARGERREDRLGLLAVHRQ